MQTRGSEEGREGGRASAIGEGECGRRCGPSAYQLGKRNKDRAAIEHRNGQEIGECQPDREEGGERDQRQKSWSRSRTLQAGDVDSRGQRVRAAGGSDRAGDISHGCFGSLPGALQPQKHGFPYAHMTGSEFMAPDPKMADGSAVLVVRRQGDGQRQRLSLADNLEAYGKVGVAFQDGAEIFEAGNGYAVSRGDPIARLETHSFGRAPGFDGVGDCHKGDLAC